MPSTISENMNHLCLIEGDYKLSKKSIHDLKEHLSKRNAKIKNLQIDSSKSRIDDLIEMYKVNLDDSEELKTLNIIYSKDGSELLNYLLNNYGLTSSINETDSAAQLPKTIQHFSTTSNLLDPTNTSNNNFICFLINDFDQNDQAFLKLEEIQLKINSLLSLKSINGANPPNSTVSTSTLNATAAQQNNNSHKRFIIFGWPVLYNCVRNELSLKNATDVERPLYCKLMSGCFVCFTGFKKENKQMVGHCIKLVHYMGGSVRKEYNKKITHLIVKSTLSTKYKTAYNIGRCHLLTEDWIVEAWKHRDEVTFDVNNEEFLKKFNLKALYSLSIAFYGFTAEETAHMKEVTLENGGTPISDLNDPQCTHIVINDQEVKQLSNNSAEDHCNNTSSCTTTGTAANSSVISGPITPTSNKTNNPIYIDMNTQPFSNTRASIVKAEWFWASIQICCRASECLYEFTKPKLDAATNPLISQQAKPVVNDPPHKRIKLSSDNLLSNDMLNSSANACIASNLSQHNTDSPHHSHHFGRQSTSTHYQGSPQQSHNVSQTNQQQQQSTHRKNSSNNLLNDYDSPSICHSNLQHHPGVTMSASAGPNPRLSSDRLLNSKNNISNNLSTSASLLDATNDDGMSIDSPYEKQRNDSSHGILNSASSNGPSKKVNKRSLRINELFETEKRFVSILQAIIVYFKEPIEAPDQVAGPILDQTEAKEIFGNLPPIYEVHCRIKERLERIVEKINKNGGEEKNPSECLVGEIYQDNAEALLKTYPPFVNFYEKTKDAILNCDKIKPRFHAFLKIAQSKPECGRQTLVELLIRPVQRLPSTLLLLDDVLKETPKTHKDHELLSKAIGSLKEVMTHINEDKRKVDNQLTMFVLMNDIENCPATLLSSHRNFLKKIDCYEMTNELLKKGAHLTLFLFSDCLEICKPRLKLLNANKSPSANQKPRTPSKCYKHIALFNLNYMTKVCDIVQNNDDTDLFAIICRLPNEKDKFFSFKVVSQSSSSSNPNNTTIGGGGNPNTTMSNSHSGNHIYSSTMSTNNLSIASSAAHNLTSTTTIYASTTNLNFYDDHHYQAINEKKEYIKLLAQGICNVKCITEYENILCTVEAKQLQMDLNDSGGSKKLEVVKSYAKNFNRRVSRAFSFSQDTPNKIKKTISSVFRSPFQTSYSQQSLNEQKSSKLASLASLQLTPTLVETKRKFITLQKTRDLSGQTSQIFMRQQNINTQTTSSLLSLDTYGGLNNENMLQRHNKIISSSSSLESTNSNKLAEHQLEENNGDLLPPPRRLQNLPDVTNVLHQSNSFKRQFNN